MRCPLFLDDSCLFAIFCSGDAVLGPSSDHASKSGLRWSNIVRAVGRLLRASQPFALSGQRRRKPVPTLASAAEVSELRSLLSAGSLDGFHDGFHSNAAGEGAGDGFDVEHIEFQITETLSDASGSDLSGTDLSGKSLYPNRTNSGPDSLNQDQPGLNEPGFGGIGVGIGGGPGDSSGSGDLAQSDDSTQSDDFAQTDNGNYDGSIGEDVSDSGDPFADPEILGDLLTGVAGIGGSFRTDMKWAVNLTAAGAESELVAGADSSIDSGAMNGEQPELDGHAGVGGVDPATQAGTQFSPAVAVSSGAFNSRDVWVSVEATSDGDAAFANQDRESQRRTHSRVSGMRSMPTVLRGSLTGTLTVPAGWASVVDGIWYEESWGSSVCGITGSDTVGESPDGEHRTLVLTSSLVTERVLNAKEKEFVVRQGIAGEGQTSGHRRIRIVQTDRRALLQTADDPGVTDPEEQPDSPRLSAYERLEFDQGPRGPPGGQGSDRLGTFTDIPIQLHRLRYSIAPRGPSLVSNSRSCLQDVSFAGPGLNQMSTSVLRSACI